MRHKRESSAEATYEFRNRQRSDKPFRPQEADSRSKPQRGHDKLPRTVPFKWPGSKKRMMSRIIPLIPDHDRYVSAYGGSGADIYAKYRSKIEVYNDLNSAAVNFFQVLRDKKRREELTYRLCFTPHSRAVYGECRALLQKDGVDPLALAWAFYYSATFSFCSRDPSRSDVSMVLQPKYRKWRRTTDHINQVATRFAAVLLENVTWEEVVTKHDGERTFFYCDPPYVHSTRNKPAYYRHEMTDEDHVALLDRLQSVKGRVMLSGYPSKLYQDRLGGWRRVGFDVVCSSSPKEKKPINKEVLWMNYQEDGTRIKTV
jgi:DNA adenine methylase